MLKVCCIVHSAEKPKPFTTAFRGKSLQAIYVVELHVARLSATEKLVVSSMFVERMVTFGLSFSLRCGGKGQGLPQPAAP